MPDRLQAARRIVHFTIFLDLLGFGLIIPLLQYHADPFHANPALISMIQAIYLLMQFVFAPFSGRRSDRIGRRPVLLVSIAGSSLSYVLVALAQNAQMILLYWLLAGITVANLSTAQAYIADVTPAQEHTRAMGMIGAAFGVGFILGLTVGGVLGAWCDNFVIGMRGALLAAANWLSAFPRLPESLPPEKRRAATDKYPFTLRDLARVLATGGGVAGPSLSGLPSRLAPSDHRGEIFGAVQSLSSLARVAGPLWGGWRFGHLGISAPYLTAAMLVLVAVRMVASVNRIPCSVTNRNLYL